LEYNYEPTIPMVVPEELLNFEMTRAGSRTVIWPPRMQMFENNNSAELNLRTIKYSVREFGDAGGGADWQEAADRAGRSYKDLLGMPYTIPKGMSSLELLTDMPLFVGTPHHYFNKGMSGYEFLQFVGLDASTAERYDEFETYIEIDPITGKLMRGAKRFQYNYRIETNSLNPDLVECISPTDSFSMNGYGCVIYHPAFFMDESNIMDYAESSRLKYSWYDIPSYILYATVISGVFGGIILVISVRVIKLTNKAEIIFKQRIYID